MAGIQLPSESVHQHNDLNSSSIGDNDDSNSNSSSINIHPEIDHHTIIESVRKHFEVKEREGVIFYHYTISSSIQCISIHISNLLSIEPSINPFIHYLYIYICIHPSIDPSIHICPSFCYLSIHPPIYPSINLSIHPSIHQIIHPIHSLITIIPLYTTHHIHHLPTYLPIPAPLHDKSIYVDIFKISYSSKDELRHVNFELKGQYYMTL